MGGKLLLEDKIQRTLKREFGINHRSKKIAGRVLGIMARYYWDKMTFSQRFTLQKMKSEVK